MEGQLRLGLRNKDSLCVQQQAGESSVPLIRGVLHQTDGPSEKPRATGQNSRRPRVNGRVGCVGGRKCLVESFQMSVDMVLHGPHGQTALSVLC